MKFYPPAGSRTRDHLSSQKGPSDRSDFRCVYRIKWKGRDWKVIQWKVSAQLQAMRHMSQLGFNWIDGIPSDQEERKNSNGWNNQAVEDLYHICHGWKLVSKARLGSPSDLNECVFLADNSNARVSIFIPWVEGLDFAAVEKMGKDRKSDAFRALLKTTSHLHAVDLVVWDYKPDNWVWSEDLQKATLIDWEYVKKEGVRMTGGFTQEWKMPHHKSPITSKSADICAMGRFLEKEYLDITDEFPKLYKMTQAGQPADALELLPLAGLKEHVKRLSDLFADSSNSVTVRELWNGTSIHNFNLRWKTQSGKKCVTVKVGTSAKVGREQSKSDFITWVEGVEQEKTMWISGCHFQIQIKNGAAFLTDLSMHGTTFGGRKIPKGITQPLGQSTALELAGVLKLRAEALPHPNGYTSALALNRLQNATGQSYILVADAVGLWPGESHLFGPLRLGQIQAPLAMMHIDGLMCIVNKAAVNCKFDGEFIYPDQAVPLRGKGGLIEIGGEIYSLSPAESF